MAVLLEQGGRVELWGGWAVVLPACYYERNSDGSWSSWGADWALDVHIVETNGDSNGKPLSAAQMLGRERTVNSEGRGWIGEVKLLKETDSGREVFRLAAHLAATNTILSFWVSYFEDDQRSFAEELVRGVTYGLDHQSDFRR